MDLGVIRDTYDELVEAKMEKKRAERDALKQKLIIIIVVLIVITSGNVWFIWYRWQSSREQERDQRKIILMEYIGINRDDIFPTVSKLISIPNRIKMTVKWIRMLNRIVRGYTRRLERPIRQSTSILNQQKQVLHGNQVFIQLFIKEENPKSGQRIMNCKLINIIPFSKMC